MIYLDASALVKFVKRESDSAALREWRLGLAHGTLLLTSELARLEIAPLILTSPLPRAPSSRPPWPGSRTTMGKEERGIPSSSK